MAHMKVGYARTSTLDQLAGFEAQMKELKNAGCKKVFREQVSSASKRKELDAALDHLRDGDKLVLTKLVRLARSIAHLAEVTKVLAEKSAKRSRCRSGSLARSRTVHVCWPSPSMPNRDR